MSTIDNLRLTPATISDRVYEIPLYQRLFEWDSERITQLLDDLRERQMEARERKLAHLPYYIGMLTSTAKNELVDGQQRFTVMMLMGIAFSTKYEDNSTPCYAQWKDFVLFNGKLRLTFSARPEDQEYLLFLTQPAPKDSAPYVNQKMKKGLDCVQDYLKKEFESEEERTEFGKYVFENMTFFISCLPENYHQTALNKYFERMNSSGKNLEGHEIVKVYLLQKLVQGHDKEFFTKVWNRVSDMNTPCFHVRREESEEQMKGRIHEAIASRNIHDLFDSNKKLLNGLAGTEKNEGEFKSIKAIKESPNTPDKSLRTGNGSHSVMSFPDFLLQCLYRFLKQRGKDVGEISIFFNKAHIIKTFNERLFNWCSGKDIEDFYSCLARYRVLMDVYFVRILDGQGDYDYDLETPFVGKDDEVKTLEMFESMLYVNSSPKSYYFWFNALLDAVDKSDPVEPAALFAALKAKDDEIHSKENLDEAKLTYPEVDRYWFWRLDFQIWLRRKELFSVQDGSVAGSEDLAQAINIAEKYVFKRKRSIEHIAPQTPEQQNTLRLGEGILNSFGNLAMISSEQNSSLSNSTYQEKKARVESFLSSSRSGSIESLKMLHAFVFNKTWSEDAIKKHGEKMLNLLKDSYE